MYKFLIYFVLLILLISFNNVERYNEQIGFDTSAEEACDINNLEVAVDTLKYIGKTFTKDVTINESEYYENCVFNGINVYVANNSIIRGCDFVNSILLPKDNKGINHCSITYNKFIGRNSRIQMSQIIDCKINYNEFPISDTRYPNATPKTKGEHSRNVFTNVLSKSEFIGNHVYIGRTGLISLGENSDFRTDNLDEYSSSNNIITDNIMEGCGEEYISFDGGITYDVGKITKTSVAFFEVGTGQMINGKQETSEQTKVVAHVTLSLTSEIQGYPNYEFIIKNYPSILKGIYCVGLKNSKYYKVMGVTLVGDIAVDPSDSMAYSVAGTYELTIEVPTVYTFKNTPISTQQKNDIISNLVTDWSVNDFVFVGSINSGNIINNNIIRGIGTDTMGDVSDMGGIVMYGVCLNNTINNNSLNQRRIWFQQWNNDTPFYISKIKLQSYNTIANNTIQDSYISMVNLYTNGFNNGMILNRGNRLIGNIVNGTTAGIKVVKQSNVLLMGNFSKKYVITDCDKVKLVGNSKEDESTLINNTNVLTDATDEI